MKDESGGNPQRDLFSPGSVELGEIKSGAKGTSGRKNHEPAIPLPEGYIKEKVREVARRSKLGIIDLARRAGYERTAMHRILGKGKGTPKLAALYALACQHDLSMDYWFPPRELARGTLELEAWFPHECRYLEDVSRGVAPLTAQVAEAVKPLSAIEKNMVLRVLRDPASLGTLKAVAQLDDRQQQLTLQVAKDPTKLEIIELLDGCNSNELSVVLTSLQKLAAAKAAK